MSSSGVHVEPKEKDLRTPMYPCKLSKPVIAAVNGAVAGIGLAFALWCDLRFSTKSAKFVTAFSRRGLVAEWGIDWTLPRLVGQGNAMMMLLSSEVMLGEEAYRLGIVQRVVDDNVLAYAVAFAKGLASKVSPVSMAVIKKQLWHGHMQPEEALRRGVDLMRLSVTKDNPDFAEGVKSFVEKRPPHFPSLSQANPVVSAVREICAKL